MTVQGRMARPERMDSVSRRRVPDYDMPMARTLESHSPAARPEVRRRWRASRSIMSETRVLIVDDEPLARDVIRNLLAGVEGMTVIGECRNGVEAVDAVRMNHPDLLFLDI